MNLLIHQAALGDWVLTFPVLRGLAVNGPTLAVSSWSKAKLAAKMIGGVTPVNIDQRDFTLLHAAQGWKDMSPAGRKLFASLDGWIISFVSSGTDVWAENVRRLAPEGKCCFVSPRPPLDYPEHVTNWHREQLQRQGLSLSNTPVAPRLNQTGLVVIHIGAGSQQKCWPLPRFVELADLVSRSGKTVQLIAGEVEAASASPDFPLSTVLSPLHLSSLDQLYETLAAASLFIGNDSGPTHLAAQMGLPTISLFGPTSPDIWRPIGPCVTLLAPPAPAPMTWLDVPAVSVICDHDAKSLPLG